MLIRVARSLPEQTGRSTPLNEGSADATRPGKLSSPNETTKGTVIEIFGMLFPGRLSVSAVNPQLLVWSITRACPAAGEGAGRWWDVVPVTVYLGTI
jgi:hypothetical protein